MGQEYINTQLQDRLFNHELSIDKEALWQNIAVANKRRTPFWVYWAGVVLLILSGYLVFSQFQKNLTNPIATHSNNNDLNQGNPKNNNSNASIAASDIDSNTSDPDLINANQKVTTDKLIVITNNTSTDQQTKVKATSTSHTNANQPQNTNFTASTKNIETDVKENKEVTIENGTLKTDKSNNTELAYKITKTQEANRPLQIANLNHDPLNIISYSRPYSELNLEFKKNSQNCFSFGKERHPWSLYAYAGPSVLMKNLSTNTIESETYRSQRESNENVLESIRAGLQLKYQWDNGWYVKAGVEMNRLNEKIQFSNSTDSTYTLTNQVIRVIVDSQGNEIPVYGDITVTETKTQNWTIFNKYKFVNLPIALGYQKSKNRWSYGAELGVHINLAFDFEGTLLTENGQPSMNPDFLKDNAGIALSLTGGIGYQILPRAKLWLTPSVMKLMKPINVDSYPIDQSYTTMGLLLGLEFKF